MTPFVAGSPKTVADRLADVVTRTNINYLLCVFSFGDLAPEAAMRSMDLFAKEVMPKVRAAAAAKQPA